MNRASPVRSNISQIALGDLTNRLGKRGFSLISRSPASKNAKSASKENIPQSANRVLLGDKNCKRPKSGVNGEKSLPLLKGGKTYRLLSCVNGGNQLNSVERGPSGYSQTVSKCEVENGGIGLDSEHKDESQTTRAEPLLETLGSQTASNDGIESGFSSMPAARECPQFTGSDSLESCSCSFCSKAAHILSELHYMDVKARMSAVAKSKKAASNLVRTCSSDNGTGKGRKSLSHISSSEDESDLLNRSKSLFISMEDKFGMECSQLENQFSSLKDIRERLKMNLMDQMAP